MIQVHVIIKKIISCLAMKIKKVLGKFKDELGGVPISEYVGLRPKMYSVITKEEEIRKAKGVKRM